MFVEQKFLYIENGRFKIVKSESGVITPFRPIEQRTFKNLTKNCGWI